MNTMHDVSKYDIAEIRSMNNPPKMIKRVMNAFVSFWMLKKLPQKKSDGSFKQSYW